MTAPQVCSTDQRFSINGSVQQILNSFQGSIPPIKTTATYTLGIFAVTVVMILLPLLYLALIGVVGYAVYWHTVNNVDILQHGRGRGKAMVFLIYTAPLVVGSIMVLFMLKPLFARPVKRRSRRRLSRSEEPALFAFVDRVCEAVHAPRPKCIDIDCDINASASFRRGVWSMLFGNDLVLTIGMPLVVGLSLRQFAGVLAHEFGHFSQGAGMRLTFIIRTISVWFTRVVYERDTWDEWLEQTARSIDLRIGWILHLARFFVWLSRRFLWVLMIVGHGVAGYMLQQMEFDADRHQARLAGSEAIPQTIRRLIELNIANSGAEQDLRQFYREGRLGDNLPRLIQVNVDQFPAEYQEKITEMIEQSETGRFDTHPADKDRIESARLENAAGIFQQDGPATVLFQDAAATCQAVTTDVYEEIFGTSFRRCAVHSLDDLLARQNRDQESIRAMARYFQGTFNLLRPLPIPKHEIAAPRDAVTTIQVMRAARENMLQALPAYQSAFEKLDDADTRLLQVGCADSVFNANETPDPAQFLFEVDSRASVQNASEFARRQLTVAEPDLTRFEVAARQRLTSALELLFDPQVAQRIENSAEHQAEVRRVLPVLQRVNATVSSFLAIRNKRMALSVLYNYVKEQENSAALIQQITQEGKSLALHLSELKQAFQPLAYPFDHARGPISVGDFVLEAVPPEDAFGDLYQAAADVLDSLGTLASRGLGRISQIAETVESTLGLPPLQDPEKTA